MKVVCCKKCGAKYQLDDDDDISAFECSSCAGDLEVIEDYSDDNESSKSTILTSQKYASSYIVQCSDCGLKYKINKNDNILDYECDGCGGLLFLISPLPILLLPRLLFFLSRIVGFSRVWRLQYPGSCADNCRDFL